MNVSAGPGASDSPSPGFVRSAMARTNRNLRLTCLAVLCTVAVSVAVTWRYWYNFAFGPFVMEPIDLARMKTPENVTRYFVRVKSRDRDSIGRRVKTRNGEVTEVISELFLARMADTLLLATVAPGASGDFLTGALTATPDDMKSSLKEAVMKSARSPEGRARLSDRILPFMLDGGTFREAGYIALAFVVPVAGLALWGLTLAARREADPSRHPLLKELARHGDTDEIAAALDDEVAMMGGAPKGLSAFATTGWFVHRAGPYHVHVRKLTDLAWVYVKSTRHSVNGIPTGTTFGIVVWDRHGRALNIGDARGKGGEKAAVELIQKIRDRAPWVMGGYGTDLERLWKTDRAGWLKAVDDIRAKGSG